jgi:hypothetical protein
MATWSDISGQEHSITDHNSPTLSTDVPSGFSGYSTVFNGSNQYLSIPHHADFNFGTGNYTLDAWIKITDITTWGAIIQKFNYNSSTSYFYGYNIDYRYSSPSTYQCRYLAGNDYANRVLILNSFTPDTDTWYHVAGYKNGTSHYLAIDGSAVSQTKTSTNHDTSYDIYVAREYTNLGASTTEEYFEGKIFLPRVTSTNLWSTTSFTVPGSSDYNETGQVLLIEAQEDVRKKIFPVSSPLSGNLTNLGVI